MVDHLKHTDVWVRPGLDRIIGGLYCEVRRVDYAKRGRPRVHLRVWHEDGSEVQVIDIPETAAEQMPPQGGDA